MSIFQQFSANNHTNNIRFLMPRFSFSNLLIKIASKKIKCQNVMIAEKRSNCEGQERAKTTESQILPVPLT